MPTLTRRSGVSFLLRYTRHVSTKWICLGQHAIFMNWFCGTELEAELDAPGRQHYLFSNHWTTTNYHVSKTNVPRLSLNCLASLPDKKPAVLIFTSSTHRGFLLETSTLLRVHALPPHVCHEQRPRRGTMLEADLCQLRPSTHGENCGCTARKLRSTTRSTARSTWIWVRQCSESQK